MRLTDALMFFKRLRHVPGKITIGKNRVKARITPWMKEKAVRDLIVQDRNLKVICAPYLTAEEEEGHVTDQPKYMERKLEAMEQKRADKMFKHRYTIDHLQPLEDSRKWE